MQKLKKNKLESMFKGIIFFAHYCWNINKMYILWLLSRQILTIAYTLMLIIFPQHIIDAAFGMRNFNITLLIVTYFVIALSSTSVLLNFTQKKIINNKMLVYKEFQIYISKTMMEADYQKIESNAFLNTKAKAEQFLFGGGNGFATVLESAFQVLGDVITLITLAGILFQLNYLLVFVIIALVLINTISNYFTKKRNINISMEQAVQERRSKYYSDISQNYKYGKEIRVYNLEKWILGKYSRQLDFMREFYKKISSNNFKYGNIVTLTTAFQQMFSYIFVTYNAFMEKITIGQFSMYISSISTFASTLKNIADNIISLQQYSIYYEAYKEYIHNEEDNKKGSISIEEVKDIEFVNVSFKYADQNEYALKNINVKINAKDKIMIVGENGSGKSTFIKLLLRIYKPESGRILINGIDINTIDYETYSKMFATVFQDFALFSFRICENVGFSNNIDSKRLDNIFENIGLKDKIDSLRYKENTFVYRDFDNGGYTPSGGENQKIAMSRAIYRDSAIVILDEPTAALDPVAENELYVMFDKMFSDKTCIYISHRLSSVKLCNKILFFSEGYIVESGTHEELLMKNGEYAKLYNLQAQHYVNI